MNSQKYLLPIQAWINDETIRLSNIAYIHTYYDICLLYKNAKVYAISYPLLQPELILYYRNKYLDSYDMMYT